MKANNVSGAKKTRVSAIAASVMMISFGINSAHADLLGDLKGAIQRGVQDPRQGNNSRSTPGYPMRNPSAGDSGPAGRSNQVQGGGNFPADVPEYDGPSRFTAPINTNPLGGVISDEPEWPLAEGKVLMRSVNDQRFAQWPALSCTYRSPQDKNLFRSAGFWKQRRPELNISNMQNWLRTSSVSADVAVESCPPSWGEAMRLAWGENAWESVKTAFETQNKNREARSKAWEAEKKVAAAKWRQGTLVAYSAEKNRAIATKLDEAIGKIVVLRRSGQLTHDSYRKMLEDVVPILTDLARSGAAQASAIPKGLKGRPQFVAWDEGIAYTVISRTRRLRTISEEVWSATDLLHIWYYYLELYKEQLSDKGGMDPVFAKRMASELEKRRDKSQQPLVPVPDFSPTFSSNTLNQDQTSVLESTVSQAVAGVGNFLVNRAKAQKYVADLDRVTGMTRLAFWKCYETQCASAAQSWLDYSMMLNQKDDFYIGNYIGEAVINRSMNGWGEMFVAFVGMSGDVDGGLFNECKPHWDRFFGSLGTFIIKANLSDVVQFQAFMREQQRKEPYREWRSCRDRMEFILRPRSKGGLIQGDYGVKNWGQ